MKVLECNEVEEKEREDNILIFLSDFSVKDMAVAHKIKLLTKSDWNKQYEIFFRFRTLFSAFSPIEPLFFPFLEKAIGYEEGERSSDRPFLYSSRP